MQHLDIRTIVRRDYDTPHLMNFEVLCGDQSGFVAARLEGFLLDLGYYPETSELDAVDFLDGRSAHALEAFEVLADNKTSVEALLSCSDISTFIHLEEAKVNPNYRGRGLALRLMREARFALNGYGRIVTLKAYPLEGEATVADQAKLATYYQSDARLGFQAIAPVHQPGKLVASWDEPMSVGSDGPIW